MDIRFHEAHTPDRSWETHAPRALRLLPMNLVEQSLQGFLQRLILCALIELADEMTARLQGLEAELEGRSTKVLRGRPLASDLCLKSPALGTHYHASSVIAKVVTTRVHHPKIRVGQRSLPEACGLLPGFAHVTQDHVHHPLRVCFRLFAPFCFFSNSSSMCRLLLFKVNVSLLQLLESAGVDRSFVFFLGRGKQVLAP